MCKWHETFVAKLGLRVIGLGLVLSAWTEGHWLRVIVTNGPTGTASEMLLAALIFTSASAGMAMAIMGSGLLKTVRVSERWVRRTPFPVSRRLKASPRDMGGA